MSFWTGKPSTIEQIPTISKAQQPLANQLYGAAGAGGGAFNQAGNFWRSLLSNESPDVEAFAAPEMRRFREDILPGISHSFGGTGSGPMGSLSSSAFQSAKAHAGADLAERIAAIRAGLRQQGAQGLFNLGQQALSPFTENVYRERVPGMLETLAPIAGQAAGAFAGPLGSTLGEWAGKTLSQKLSGRSSNNPSGGFLSPKTTQ